MNQVKEKRSKIIRLALKVVFLMLILIAVVSCGRPEYTHNSQDHGGSNSSSSTTSDAGALVIYSGRSEKLVGPIIDQFRTATDIDVSVKYGKTSEIAALLLEEGSKSPADVFISQDPTGFGVVGDLLAVSPSDIQESIPEWARSKDGKWIGISGRTRVVVYNTDLLKPEDVPSSMEAFTDPEWNGLIGWAPTNGSFQAMVTAMRMLWGEERTREWLQGIKDNNPKEYPKNTPTVDAVAKGEVSVGFVNHYYLYRFIAEHGEKFSARNKHLGKDDPGSVILASGVGILGTSDNTSNAEKFVRFLLSEPTQQYFASQTYEYPMVEGVKIHPLLEPLSEINKADIDLASLSDLSGTQALLRDLGIIP